MTLNGETLEEFRERLYLFLIELDGVVGRVTRIRRATPWLCEGQLSWECE